MEQEILELLKASPKKVMGQKQVLREIFFGNISGVIVAKNVDSTFFNKVITAIEGHNTTNPRDRAIKVWYANSKEWLGQVLEIDRPCGVCGILKS
ncbi:MAG: ribosomal L7Ae/L30e/S12e/Gadd45 family protein [Firmicutes bacterium]|nr:ribosomal L7Ae/L30e/S12e/Gadd45 family protein [Bacillota bacterium]